MIELLVRGDFMSLKDKEFYRFLKQFSYITSDEEFKKLKTEVHHGSNRYDHSVRVALKVYKLAKRFNLNYVSATRAALLHDFFIRADLGDVTDSEELVMHPSLAVENAKKRFNISKKEANIMITHMYPVTKEAPTTKEGWLLTYADKAVSVREYMKYRVLRMNSPELSIVNDVDFDGDSFREKDMLSMSMAINLKVNTKNCYKLFSEE